MFLERVRKTTKNLMIAGVWAKIQSQELSRRVNNSTTPFGRNESYFFYNLY
jgi:hypothetical protein